MKRYAEVIHLRPEHQADYIRHHTQVWPEVLATIAACNIRNYSIFLRKGTLFAYFEYHGADYAADMRRMAACPHTQRWWSIMDPCSVSSKTPGRWRSGRRWKRSSTSTPLPDQS